MYVARVVFLSINIWGWTGVNQLFADANKIAGPEN
jgi:hypothetical protein